MADFHLHSTFSDGKLSIPELVDLFGSRKAATYLGRSLTPASFPLYSEILKSEAERAYRKYGMVVIPGLELTQNSVSNHRSAHVLALGVDEFIEANGDVSDLARTIRSKGGLAIAAHSVSTRKVEKQTYHLWDRHEELAPLFDAWEVASGPYLFSEVAASNLPKIASSDLHAPKQITSWKTVLHCEKKPEAILQAIRRQQLSVRFYEGAA